jgi:S-adenosylmethionine decarboxylase|tara:strand:+ start:697 stop:1041 length:345 start_codon:yes stop_codon:yes gene_type:complete
MTEAMHLIADLTCFKGADDAQAVEEFMREAIEQTGLTIRHFHIEAFKNGSSFGPGVTGIALLAESHMVVHTAPERHALNLDLFSCKPFSAAQLKRIIWRSFGRCRTQRWEILHR